MSMLTTIFPDNEGDINQIKEEIRKVMGYMDVLAWHRQSAVYGENGFTISHQNTTTMVFPVPAKYQKGKSS